MIKVILAFGLTLTSAFANATDLIDIRNMFGGSPMALPSGTTITVIVISDRANANTHGQNAIVQDYTAGICLRSDIPHTLNMNDSITVDVSGDTLSEFNGLLQISGVDLASATVHGTGEPGMITTSIADILNNMNSDQSWESMLVRITNVTITNATTGIYSGNDTLTDPSGSMILFTRSQATFASNALPQGECIVIGFITVYGFPEISIRNLDDVDVNPSVPEMEWANKIRIYPNPASNYFTIDFDGNWDVEVSIADVSGKMVADWQNLSPLARIAVDDLENGMYFVSFREGDFLAVRRISVMN